ncbi:unnamed protein product [Cuscuta epithymum]|uniref:RNase H type-1 domain-containing protein n=1 Tax=Cuscuta epithymum TaxID=186058 RepID=A0AAV0DXU3_9ASTE|nr:unnamed protein product [Cuscuta epithymum]
MENSNLFAIINKCLSAKHTGFDRGTGKSAAGFLLRDHAGAVVAAEGFPLSGSGDLEEKALERAAQWVETLRLPNLEVEGSVSRLQEDGSKFLGCLSGLSYSVVPAQVNQAAILVAKMGLDGNFIWQQGEAFTPKLRGLLH